MANIRCRVRQSSCGNHCDAPGMWWVPVILIMLGASAPLSYASCATPETHVWLSTSSSSSEFADVPVFNASGPTTVYVWGRVGVDEHITDLSLTLSSSSEIEFTSVSLDNPLLGMEAGNPVRRFETTPAPVIHPRLIEFNGFTLLNQDTIGRGWGVATQGADALYVAETNVWRLGSVTFTANESTELSLQVGVNGFQGLDASGSITPDFGVVFGDELDGAVCAIDQRGVSSSRADAVVTGGMLDGSLTTSGRGSFSQSPTAQLTLALGDSQARTAWLVRDRAELAGGLSLTSSGYVDPATPGKVDRLTLIAAQAIEGQFDSVTLDDRSLFTSSAESTVMIHDGAGMFRTLQYAADELSLTNYLALPGDFNGDLEVSFADFLILSRNFQKSGNWTDGDATGDGKIAFADFLLLSKWFGEKAMAAPAQAVPEPSSWCLAIICVVASARFFRRRDVAQN